MSPRLAAVLARALKTVLPALAVLPACSSVGEAEPAPEENVAWMVAHGRYDEAVRRAAERHDARPDDPRAEAEHRLASTAWLLERGRRLYFDGEDEEALAVFRQALDITPDPGVVSGWIEATLDKLADRWFETGLEQHVQLDLDQAIAAYEKALGYRPQHRNTRETLARALVQQNHRRGMGEEYYDDGIVALDRYFLHEARSLFTYVLKYEPENDRASLRGDQTQSLLASQRMALAAGMEGDGNFSAARNEYRIALLLDPELPGARPGLERMQREEQAAEALRTAERLLLKQRFDEAEESLGKARAITERQLDACESLTVALREARLEALYEAARVLERDWRYEEAVQAYARLLDEAPFYRDSIARMDTLDSYVREATELYARYEAAQGAPERLDLLRQIAVFWPEYRDVSLRLAELQPADDDAPR